MLASSFGYLWWRLDGSRCFASLGYRSTDCLVVPDLELVVARMQNSPELEGAVSYRTEVLPIIRHMVRQK
jgi:hypothetical protein